MKPTVVSSIRSVEVKISTVEEAPIILRTLTVYNPTPGQCDMTPLITASNAKIDTIKLKLQQLRWIALSRNLLKRFKGNFNYGDTVRLFVGDPQIDGLWIIQDTLNKRYTDRGDLLFDRSIRSMGLWKNVKIYKV
ncbi:hypothetical protein BH09BAC3_BH09BAC3_26470 [soil metagenome]